MKPWKHSLCRLTGALIAAAAMSLPAAAQELSFYYPVAVGGPVTRIIPCGCLSASMYSSF